MLCRKGLHKLTPENTRADGAGCRVCKQIANRARYARSDKRQVYMQAWRAANVEKVKEHARRSHANPNATVKAKEWSQNNAERLKEIKRRWEKANVEKRRQYSRDTAARIRARDPKAAGRRSAAWAKANPELAAANGRATVARRRARKLAARSIPFTRTQLEQRMAYHGHRCWMCGGPFEDVDHVKPLSKGGWHALMNLRPACRSCNRRKNASWPWPVRAVAA